jgi:hypothetical protein
MIPYNLFTSACFLLNLIGLLFVGNRQDALTLLFATSVATGSLNGLLRCISYLRSGPQTLSAEALPSISTLKNIAPLFELPLPHADTISASLLANVGGMTLEAQDLQDYRSSFCCDGSYLYVWHGLDLSLRKVGTGFHHSIPGCEHLVSDGLEAQLRQMLGGDVYESGTAHPSFRGEGGDGSGCSDHHGGGKGDVGEAVLPTALFQHPGCAALRPSDSSRDMAQCLACGGRYLTCFGSYGRRGAGVWHAGVCQTEDECPESPNEHFCSQACEDHGEYGTAWRTREEEEEEEEGDEDDDGESRCAGGTGERDRFVQGWVSCINGRLFLRMHYLLGPFRAAVFSCESLVLEDIVEIDFPLPAFAKAKKSYQRQRRAAVGHDVSEDEEDEEGEDEDEEWMYGEEVVDLLRGPVMHGEPQSRTTCVNLTAWEPALSDDALDFSDDCSTCHRLHNASCNPTSMLTVSHPSVAMICKFPEKKNTMNRLSIGIAHKGFKKNGSCRAFGLGDSSWGFYEDISNASDVMKINACGAKVTSCPGLVSGDLICVRYDRAAGKAWLLVDRAGGDFSRPVVKQEFRLHTPGHRVDLVMGAIYADDYRLELMDLPPPPIPELDIQSTAQSEARGAFVRAAPTSAVVTSTSSNFSTEDPAIGNLLADDSTWDADVHFKFAADDVDREVTVRLAQPGRVVTIGSSFHVLGAGNCAESTGVSCRVFVSRDGVDFVEFGTEGAHDGAVENCMVNLSPSEAGMEAHRGVYSNVQYIRFQYDSGGQALHRACAVRRIAVKGHFREKGVATAPMLPMTSDGKHLFFFNLDTCEYDAKGYAMLQSYCVNPMSSTSAVLQQEYAICDFPAQLMHLDKDKFLSSCSFACNGYNLIVSFPDYPNGDKVNSVSYCMMKLDCQLGVRCGDESFSTSTFSRDIGYPSSLCYDDTNNMIWAWDAGLKKFLRWRSGRLSPRITARQPSEGSDLLLSVHPQHRLDALSTHPERDTSHEVQAAYLLSLLDNISFCYSLPEKPMAESDMLNEIQISSGWNKTGYFCDILIRGQRFGQCRDGFNFITLDENFYPQSFVNFKTLADGNSPEMIQFIREIPEGVVTLVAGHSNSPQGLSSTVKAALRSIGAKKVDTLKAFLSFTLIGIKGGSPSRHTSVQHTSETPKTDVTVKQRIPSIYTPLCFECQQPTFSILFQLIEEQFSVCTHRYQHEDNRADDSVDVSMLISSLNLLTTNTLQLLSSVPLQQAKEIYFGDDDKCVLSSVNGIVERVERLFGDCEEMAVLLSVTLRFVVVSIELIKNTPTSQFLCLFEYFEKLLLGEFGEGVEAFVLESMLQKFTPPFVSKCLLSPDFTVRHFYKPASDAVSLISYLLAIGENDVKRKLQCLGTSAGPSFSVGGGKEYGSGSGAEVLLANMCAVLLSEASQTIVTSSSSPSSSSVDTAVLTTINTASAAAMEKIFAVFSTVLLSSCNILEWGNEVLWACEGSGTVTCQHQAVSKIYESSCLKSLLPAILSSLSLMLKYNGHKMCALLRPSMVQAMSRFSGLFNAMKSQLVPGVASAATAATTSHVEHRTVVETLESSHPYASNERTFLRVHYPGAHKMTVTFDKACRTEKNHDYVKIWKDAR